MFGLLGLVNHAGRYVAGKVDSYVSLRKSPVAAVH
jgi:hypothetical protein